MGSGRLLMLIRFHAEIQNMLIESGCADGAVSGFEQGLGLALQVFETYSLDDVQDAIAEARNRLAKQVGISLVEK